MLTRRQRELMIFIQNHIEAEGVAPSHEEMVNGLNLGSKSGSHRLLDALVERGYINKIPNRARALEVIRKVQ
jgi:repressor LexA